MAGGTRRTDHVVQVVGDVAARQSELSRQPRDRTRFFGEQLDEMLAEHGEIPTAPRPGELEAPYF